MSLGLRLMMLLSITACAEPLQIVPDSDWRTVPVAQRDTLDQQYQADLAAARAELAAASASLAAFQKAPPTAHAAGIKVDPGDAWARDHERARADALARVDAAVAEVQRSDLAWRRLRVDAASARIDVVVNQREVTRAQAIDRNLPGTDHYDTAPLRGQFSRAQQRWFQLNSSASAARDAFGRAGAALAAAKETYADVMRGGEPRQAAVATAAEDHARLELTGWTMSRNDIHRRRGLRHFLDQAGTAPQLRKIAFQLSPIARPPAPAPAAATPAAPGSATAASGGGGDVHPAPPARPADRAAAPTSPAAMANKPGGPPRSAPAPADHPADRAGDPSPPATALNARRPADPQLPAPRPERGSASPIPPTAVPASSKPVEPPRGTPATAERPPAAVAAPGVQGAPSAPRPAPASAAKPVQRPPAATDAHAR
jgi:hypothetical protein